MSVKKEVRTPSARIGGAEKDARTTPNELRHTSKADRLHQVSQLRAGDPAYPDHKPSNKLHSQSRSAQNPNNNKVGANNSEGGPGAGFQSTGTDEAGSC